MLEVAEILPHWQRRNHTYEVLQASLRCEEDYTIWCWADFKEPRNCDTVAKNGAHRKSSRIRGFEAPEVLPNTGVRGTGSPPN